VNGGGDGSGHRQWVVLLRDIGLRFLRSCEHWWRHRCCCCSFLFDNARAERFSAAHPSAARAAEPVLSALVCLALQHGEKLQWPQRCSSV